MWFLIAAMIGFILWAFGYEYAVSTGVFLGTVIVGLYIRMLEIEDEIFTLRQWVHALSIADTRAVDQHMRNRDRTI